MTARASPFQGCRKPTDLSPTDAIASLGERHEKNPVLHNPFATFSNKDFPDQQVTKRAAIYLNLPSNLLNLIYIRLMPQAELLSAEKLSKRSCKEEGNCLASIRRHRMRKSFSDFSVPRAARKKLSRKTRFRLRKILFCVCLKIKPAFSKISRRLWEHTYLLSEIKNRFWMSREINYCSFLEFL